MKDSLRYIAGQTGGLAVFGNNRIERGLERVMADQRGYYLVGYQPEPGTLHVGSDARFRKLKIKVKDKDLRVRTRAGFYARPTE